jgi:hypothetical protein
MATENWQSQEGNITEGPGKYDIMQAIMEGKYVEFTLQNFRDKTTKVTVVVNTLEREDGSGQSWNMVGVARDTAELERYTLRTRETFWNAEFYYDSGRRTGYYKLSFRGSSRVRVVR